MFLTEACKENWRVEAHRDFMAVLHTVRMASFWGFGNKISLEKVLLDVCPEGQCNIWQKNVLNGKYHEVYNHPC